MFSLKGLLGFSVLSTFATHKNCAQSISVSVSRVEPQCYGSFSVGSVLEVTETIDFTALKMDTPAISSTYCMLLKFCAPTNAASQTPPVFLQVLARAGLGESHAQMIWCQGSGTLGVARPSTRAGSYTPRGRWHWKGQPSSKHSTRAASFVSTSCFARSGLFATRLLLHCSVTL